MDFSLFDTRGYPTLSVKEGYGAWAPTYEQTVLDEMDLRLLSRSRAVPWGEVGPAVDLACGTGRTGAWLRTLGVEPIDGVDITPEMLAKAAAKNVYRRLVTADITATGLASGSYGLCTQSLACEHLADLGALYREAARITHAEGWFVLVGFHPHFLMKGIPTHFDRAPGDSVAIVSHVHLLSDHVKAAHAEGWSLVEMDEGVVDETWLEKKEKWKAYLGHPISFLLAWHKTRR